ncbi:M20/M25/M40 family metallo-hydrolase [Pontibacter russatus]|uniref:M20/M25/M40 family metallo-hydrolase n=1 Tax=Pontibacter russatus TaxID=2694929 RepID=UPI001379A203|nr:M20/M25/M40 family metallo-hydrolase [Pontibacter russatus]
MKLYYRVFFCLFPVQFFLSGQAAAFSDTTATAAPTRAVQKLAGAIAFHTVSSATPGETNAAAFIALHRYLQKSFPALHDRLQRKVINRYSLLYTWPGKNQALKPILLSAHLDVVPVEEATKDQWEHQPFAGAVEDGYIWGRGTMDDKYRVVAILEAVEQLVREGYQPERTLYLAFGHDEETGGEFGAGEIGAFLQAQGVQLEAVFDEGLAVADNIVPGVTEPVAFVGTAAKGNLNLQLTVKGEGGHSSVPKRDSPIYILSVAISRLHDHPFAPHMTPTTIETLELLSAKMGGRYRFAMRHYGLLKGRVLKMLAKDRATDALIRTQMAPTILAAGEKDNVMPRLATAVVNVRILSGENRETVLAHVREAIADERVEVEVSGLYIPPSPVTSTDTWTYKALSQTIRQTFPEVTLVAPALFPGSTDAKHYSHLTSNIYRFAPQVVDRQSAKLVHNVNERLSVEVFGRCIVFYDNLIRNTCGTAAKELVIQHQKQAAPVAAGVK